MYVEEERDIGIIQVNVWRSIKESYSWYAKCIANAIVIKNYNLKSEWVSIFYCYKSKETKDFGTREHWHEITDKSLIPTFGSQFQ